MVIALHRPDRIPLVTEGLAGISAYTGINDNRGRMLIKRESSGIVMVMAFVVITAFCRKEKAGLIGHIAELGFRIPGISR